MPTLNVNGKPYNVDLPPDTPLLWALRDQLGLTGTKFGCGLALCGAPGRDYIRCLQCVCVLPAIVRETMRPDSSTIKSAGLPVIPPSLVNRPGGYPAAIAFA